MESEKPEGWEELDRRVRADIERRGWHLGLVPAEAGTPGWAFSIGLSQRFDHPEILVFGPELPFLASLIEAVVERVVHGERFAAGEDHAGVLQDYPVAMRAIERKWYATFLGNACFHYGGEGFPAIQCFWPDRAGRFPWQTSFDPTWADDQPQLFHAETHRALSETLIGVLRSEGAL